MLFSSCYYVKWLDKADFVVVILVLALVVVGEQHHSSHLLAEFTFGLASC